MTPVFGPVPSRRLGRSLGVDLVPFKTCSYDCRYCQLGWTTAHTLERREWVPLPSIVAGLEERKESRPDYVTLSGSGEPTLHSRIDAVILAARKVFPGVPVAVLTNGSMLWQDGVRRQLADADLVIPSLDAGTDEVFQQVNRPCPDITFDCMVHGLELFCQEFGQKIALEVFLLDGLYDVAAEAKRIAAIIAGFDIDLVQLNTVSRPPADAAVRPVSREVLEQILPFFEQPAEIVADYHGSHAQQCFKATRDGVLALLERRPCTSDDVSRGMNLHRNEVVKYITELLDNGSIEPVPTGDKTYYRRK